MSFRTALQRSTATARIARPAIRAISSSSPRKAGHDDHHHAQDNSSSDAYTNETFFSPAMRNTLILVLASALAYPYLPSPSKTPSSPSISPDNFTKSASKDSPIITQLLAKNTPEAKIWTERNDKHLELTKEAAEERLLFQEAERPRVWRLRNTAAFEMASPNSIPVGSQVDLSDLKIKTE